MSFRNTAYGILFTRQNGVPKNKFEKMSRAFPLVSFKPGQVGEYFQKIASESSKILLWRSSTPRIVWEQPFKTGFRNSEVNNFCNLKVQLVSHKLGSIFRRRPCLLQHNLSRGQLQTNFGNEFKDSEEEGGKRKRIRIFKSSGHISSSWVQCFTLNSFSRKQTFLSSPKLSFTTAR